MLLIDARMYFERWSSVQYMLALFPEMWLHRVNVFLLSSHLIASQLLLQLNTLFWQEGRQQQRGYSLLFLGMVSGLVFILFCFHLLSLLSKLSMQVISSIVFILIFIIVFISIIIHVGGNVEDLAHSRG